MTSVGEFLDHLCIALYLLFGLKITSSECHFRKLHGYVRHHVQGAKKATPRHPNQDRLEQNSRLQDWHGTKKCLKHSPFVAKQKLRKSIIYFCISKIYLLNHEINVSFPFAWWILHEAFTWYIPKSLSYAHEVSTRMKYLRKKSTIAFDERTKRNWIWHGAR